MVGQARLGSKAYLLQLLAALVWACLVIRVVSATDDCTTDHGNGRERKLPKYTVSFLTHDGQFYLAAEEGAPTGYKLVATSSVIHGTRESETFTMFDLNGGALNSDDDVNLALVSASGCYWQAENGGNGDIVTSKDYDAPYEIFRIVRQGGDGEIKNGDKVYLKTNKGYFVMAHGHGGGQVTASREEVTEEHDEEEQFTLVIHSIEWPNDSGYLSYEFGFYGVTYTPPPATTTAECASDYENGKYRAVPKYTVSFITDDGQHYLAAEDGNPYKMVATSPVAYGAGEPETFTMFDLNGGTLNSDDDVNLALVPVSGCYWQAENGGNGDIVSSKEYTDPHEIFHIARQGGDGEIKDGDKVYLKTNKGYFVMAHGRGGGQVTAKGDDASFGGGEDQFTLVIHSVEWPDSGYLSYEFGFYEPSPSPAPAPAPAPAEGTGSGARRFGGVAYDPYLVSCRVFVDAFPPVDLSDITNAYGAYIINLNGNEIEVGKLKLQPAAQSGEAQVQEGSSICHDSITKLRFTVPLEAPVGSEVVSPLTSLVSHMMTGDSRTAAEAQTIVKYALMFDDQLDLLTYDTMDALYRDEASAYNVLKKTSQVLNIVNQCQALFTSSSVAEAMFLSLTKAMSRHYDSRSTQRGLLQATDLFDLTSPSFVSNLYKDTATDMGLAADGAAAEAMIEAVGTSVASLNNVISEASGSAGTDILKEVAKVDIILQTEVKSQVTKLVSGTIDVDLFKDSTTAQVVTSKVAETIVPVNVEEYLEASHAYIESSGGEVPDQRAAPESSSSGDDQTGVIAGAVGGLSAGLIVAGLLLYRRSKRRRRQVVMTEQNPMKVRSHEGVAGRPGGACPGPLKCCWGDGGGSSTTSTVGSLGGNQLLSGISYTGEYGHGGGASSSAAGAGPSSSGQKVIVSLEDVE
ncbi:hypothetical protein A3770_02p10980 [Chloropicon primus]|uniref:Uncharacterized protein n=1 Tax=Chloropicon primus TaxID=1764295 RepID=A0A5B8MGV4_9CHLO|nr:hypothetical protein A3770_02p10980 [Chloropicon primus]|eukprot:QDZ18580.1 hypothetical protein A3770_02p10980 [Chloropicon primus]